jgi:RimJ/RimL family protein N-acetyltransferase
MIAEKELLVGWRINLRNVAIEDAAFILGLRLDPALNAHLSHVDADLPAQVDWIKRYRRERNQFYFVIEDKHQRPWGTVRVYDLRADSFSWGSWVLKPGAPFSMAIESALLVYGFAFGELGCREARFSVRKRNSKVVDFHRRFGARIVSETESDFQFRYAIAEFESARRRYGRYMGPGQAIDKCDKRSGK